MRYGEVKVGRRAAILTAAVVALVLTAPAVADWPAWRGPGSDGVSSETGLPDSWSKDGANLAWKADFVGRSTPVVVDGQVCVIGRTDEEKITRQEIVACFDAKTGAKRWEHRFNVYHTTVPYNRVGWASLAADPETGSIFAHGVAGQLIAFDRDGTILWEQFTAETANHRNAPVDAVGVRRHGNAAEHGGALVNLGDRKGGTRKS